MKPCRYNMHITFSRDIKLVRPVETFRQGAVTARAAAVLAFSKRREQHWRGSPRQAVNPIGLPQPATPFPNPAAGAISLLHKNQ